MFEQAESLLMSQQVGSYMIRLSAASPNSVILVVRSKKGMPLSG